ncbi:MAG: dTDP-4-dehydrorhamnose 3,5-epimerase [Saprospiraceae bacterium]|nr:dTDP-4-dehydrorhamnose 3,5-epimerase [Saprospiraceae bacterium]
MPLEIIDCPISGLQVIKPELFGDERGYFYESYSTKKYAAAGVTDLFIQDNQSYSKKGVLRGLHFQAPPFAQSKLVRVTLGSVYDVAVDLRHDSPTLGQYYGLILSEYNHLQFYIPPGFAHGYLVLSDTAIFQYKCDQYYNPSADRGIRYDDPDLGISWPLTGESFEVSAKDIKLPSLKDYKTLNGFL